MDGMSGDRRDEVWFRAFFAAHHGAVLRYAARRVPWEADDIVAEVFAVAWRSRARIPDPPLPWLYAVARHVILHAHRTGARRARLDTRLFGLRPASPTDPGDAVPQRIDARNQVETLLARLSPTDAEVLRLWAWEGLEGGELAVALGCSAVAARVRLHRAVRRAGALVDLDPVATLLDPVATRPASRPGTAVTQTPATQEIR